MMNNTNLYVSCPICGDEEQDLHHRMQMLRTLCISVLFTMPLLWELHPIVQLILASIVQFGPGRYFYKGAIESIKAKVLGMDFLIASSTTIIYLYSAYITFTVHEYIKVYFLCEGVLISLILFGKYMEETSRFEASASIRKLMRLQPEKALVLRDGTQVEIGLNELTEDDVVLIQSGTHLPIDGQITEGSCLVDESMLTGESELVEKTIGDYMYCGTLCRDGEVLLSCSDISHPTMLQQIIDIVSSAQVNKSPITRFADKIASIFVPAITIGAFAVFCLWYFILSPHNLEKAIYCLCSTLVIACPCALGLATPTAIMTGSGRAAERGILFRGGEQLEKAFKVDTIVFDKTGTLTLGFSEDVSSEVIRPSASSLIQELKAKGIDIWMISGDKEAKAKRVADELQISNYMYEVKPQDKSTLVEKLRSEGHIVAMVGDGINDAPALACSDLGIALASGSDIAIDSADVLITGGNISVIPEIFDISRGTIKNIRQNLIWALMYNIIFIPIAAMGFINPSIAAAAMSLSSNGVLLNSLRAGKLRR